MKGEIEAVKTLLKERQSDIFQMNPRFLIELDLIYFTTLLRKKQIEPAIHHAQEKLLPILTSQFTEIGLALKIKVN
jgi:hypothetical protein